LKTKNQRDFEDFAADYFAFNGSLDKFDNESIKYVTEGLRWFWLPFLLDETEDSILVKNYAVYSMPSSGRCKLLNPLEQKCFIYGNRPTACRIYPFTDKVAENDVWTITLGMENCPGVTTAPSNINEEEIKQIIEQNLKETVKDYTAYEKYISEKGIKRINFRKKMEHSSKDVNQVLTEFERDWRDAYYGTNRNAKVRLVSEQKKKIVEPLAELGIIPHHPLIIFQNEALSDY
jgi:Fe-S-cluster containining protein